MEKIKSFLESEKGKNILIVLIIILLGLSSFELGRLSKGKDSSGIKIEYPNKTLSAQANAISSVTPTKTQTSTGKNFFASSRGTKYYPVGCSAGATLKQENRIYFTTREEAEQAGYELSSSCR